MVVFQGKFQVERSSAEIHHEGLQIENIWEPGAESKWLLAGLSFSDFVTTKHIKILSALPKIPKRKFNPQLVQFPR
jgi:hypothetical protein